MAASAAASTYVAGAPSVVRAIVPLRKRVRQVEPYPNQRKAADEILDCFHSEINYCLLRADVQSGKTGTYQYLIRMMLSSGMIDRAYILCGSHELELIAQCEDDIIEWHSGKQRTQVQILFRQHFEKNLMNTTRTLIIVDETHLVCGKDQSLSTFLQRHELTLIGTTERMVQNSTYILSVDATPFAEIAAMKHGASFRKGYVVLENAEGYFGPQHYLAAKLIHETFDIGTKKAMFVSLIKRFPRKYFLVRVTKRNKQYNLLMKACQGICDVVYFTSKKSDTQIALQTLETAPLRTTIVIIDGRLRCGKRVPKKHIAVVWETSVAANTDTIIQGLLGRMSGYQGDNVYQLPWNNAEKPLIFLPSKCTKRNERLSVPECDLERAYMENTLPRHASHIILGAVQSRALTEDGERYPCVPIVFQLSAEHTALLPTASRVMILDMCTQTFQLSMLGGANGHFKRQQREEITYKMSTMTSRDYHIRRFQGESQLNYYKDQRRAIETSTTCREHMDDFPLLTFCITFPDYQHEMAVPGQVVAIFYTEEEGFFPSIHLESRIPKQDGKTHFTLSPKMRECPAGMVIGFSPEIAENAAIFEKELGHFIKMSQSGIGRYSNKIELFNDNQPLVFLASVYGDNLETFHAILKRLNRQYGVNIFYTPQPKTSKDRVIINYIKW